MYPPSNAKIKTGQISSESRPYFLALVCTTKVLSTCRSLSLQHGEPPTTIYAFKLDRLEALRIITKLSIATKPSRCYQPPRLTSINSHLTYTRLLRTVDAHLLLLIYYYSIRLYGGRPQGTPL